MPTYSLTSPKTGRTYRVNFSQEPEESDMEEAVDAFDAEEPVEPKPQEASASIDPTQGQLGTLGASLARGFATIPSSLASAVVDTQRTIGDIAEKYTGPVGRQVAMSLTGGETLNTRARDFLDIYQGNVEEAYPINPENEVANVVGQAIPQAAGMLVGGGIGAGLAKTAAGAKAAMRTVPLVMGGLLGTGQGIQQAEELGVEEPESRLAMGLLTGGIEAAIESIGGIGGKASEELINGARKKASELITDAFKSIAGESLEEGVTTPAQNLVATAFASEDPNNPGFTKTGVELPNVDPTTKEFWKEIGLSMIGGAAGGTLFAGLNVASNLAQPDTQDPFNPEAPITEDDTSAEDLTLDEATALEPPAPVIPTPEEAEKQADEQRVSEGVARVESFADQTMVNLAENDSPATMLAAREALRVADENSAAEKNRQAEVEAATLIQAAQEQAATETQTQETKPNEESILQQADEAQLPQGQANVGETPDGQGQEEVIPESQVAEELDPFESPLPETLTANVPPDSSPTDTTGTQDPFEDAPTQGEEVSLEPEAVVPASGGTVAPESQQEVTSKTSLTESQVGDTGGGMEPIKVTGANLFKLTEAQAIEAAAKVLEQRESDHDPMFGTYKDDAKAKRFRSKPTKINALDLVQDTLRAKASLGKSGAKTKDIIINESPESQVARFKELDGFDKTIVLSNLGLTAAQIGGGIDNMIKAAESADQDVLRREIDNNLKLKSQPSTPPTQETWEQSPEFQAEEAAASGDVAKADRIEAAWNAELQLPGKRDVAAERRAELSAAVAAAEAEPAKPSDPTPGLTFNEMANQKLPIFIKRATGKASKLKSLGYVKKGDFYIHPDQSPAKKQQPPPTIPAKEQVDEGRGAGFLTYSKWRDKFGKKSIKAAMTPGKMGVVNVERSLAIAAGKNDKINKENEAGYDKYIEQWESNGGNLAELSGESEHGEDIFRATVSYIQRSRGDAAAEEIIQKSGKFTKDKDSGRWIPVTPEQNQKPSITPPGQGTSDEGFGIKQPASKQPQKRGLPTSAPVDVAESPKPDTKSSEQKNQVSDPIGYGKALIDLFPSIKNQGVTVISMEESMARLDAEWDRKVKSGKATKIEQLVYMANKKSKQAAIDGGKAGGSNVGGMWNRADKTISVGTNATPSAMAHELGHAIMELEYVNASRETKEAIQSEYNQWFTAKYGKDGSPSVADQRRIWEWMEESDWLDPQAPFPNEKRVSSWEDYRASFDEWFADEVAKWATVRTEPRSLVGKFFSDLSAKLEKLWNKVSVHFSPSTTLASWLDSISKPSPAKKKKPQVDTKSSEQKKLEKALEKVDADILDAEADGDERGADGLRAAKLKIERQLEELTQSIPASTIKQGDTIRFKQEGATLSGIYVGPVNQSGKQVHEVQVAGEPKSRRVTAQSINDSNDAQLDGTKYSRINNDTSTNIRSGPYANTPLFLGEDGGLQGANGSRASSEDSLGLSPEDNSARAQAIRAAGAGIDWKNATAAERIKALADFSNRVASGFVQLPASSNVSVTITRKEGERIGAGVVGTPNGKLLVEINTGPDTKNSNTHEWDNPEAAFAYAYDVMQEEAIHALHHAVAFRRWKVVGSPGKFEKFSDQRHIDSFREVLSQYSSFVKSGDITAAQKIQRALLDSWNLYRDLNNPVNSINEIVDLFMKDERVAVGLMPELTRQLVQLTQQDFTTETGWRKFFNQVKGWIQDAINSLKAVLPLARNGDLGPIIQQDIKELESMMRDYRGGKPMDKYFRQRTTRPKTQGLERSVAEKHLKKLGVPSSKVYLVDEPSFKWRGRYDPDGGIGLNIAYLNSIEELNDTLFRHEAIHDAVETDQKVKQRGVELLNALTPDELSIINESTQGYSDAEMQDEQIVEAVRLMTSRRPDLRTKWARFVEAVSLAIKKFLGIKNLDRQVAELVAARILARGESRVLKGRMGGRDKFSGNMYSGDGLFASLQNPTSGLAIDIQKLADLSESEPFKSQGFNAISKSQRSSMLNHVLGLARAEPKIFQAIIRTLPVDVVDNLFGGKTPSKVALHYETVLKNLLARNSNQSVSIPVETSNGIRLLIDKVATLRAEMILGPGKLTRALLADISAVDAGDRDGIQGTPPPFPQERPIYSSGGIAGRSTESTLASNRVRGANKKINAADFTRLLDTHGKILSSVEARDKDYIDAVSKGDMEKAQRMVDQAAKDAGYNIGPVPHGTVAVPFTEFNTPAYFGSGAGMYAIADSDFVGWKGRRVNLPKKPKPSEIEDNLDTAGFPEGVSLDGDETNGAGKLVSSGQDSIFQYQGYSPMGDAIYALVENYAVKRDAGYNINEVTEPPPVTEFPRIIRAYLKFDNPAKLDGRDGAKLGRGKNSRWDQDLYDRLTAEGYDSAIADDDWGHPSNRHYIAFSPSQIKSADPVTYDSDGNVIPLSQRFQSESPDIRYQRVPTKGEPTTTESVLNEAAANRAERLKAEESMSKEEKLTPRKRRKQVMSVEDLGPKYMQQALKDAIPAAKAVFDGDAMTLDAAGLEQWRRVMDQYSVSTAGSGARVLSLIEAGNDMSPTALQTELGKYAERYTDLTKDPAIFKQFVNEVNDLMTVIGGITSAARNMAARRWSPLTERWGAYIKVSKDIEQNGPPNIDKIKKIAKEEALDNIDDKAPKDSIIKRLLAKAKGDVTWSEFFTENPRDKQKDRQREIYIKILGSDKFKDLNKDERLELTKALDKIWRQEHGRVFLREFEKKIPLKNPKLKKQLAAQAPALLKSINLGTFDSQAYRKEIAQTYGLKDLSDADLVKVIKLGAEIQEARGESLAQRKKIEELANLVSGVTNIPKSHILASYYISSILASGRTGVGAMFSILEAVIEGIVGASISATKSPSQAMAGVKSALKAFPKGVMEGLSHFRTGDKTGTLLASDSFNQWLKGDGNSPTSIGEMLWKEKNPIKKFAGVVIMAAERMLTGIDLALSSTLHEASLTWANSITGFKDSKGDTVSLRNPTAADKERMRQQVIAEWFGGVEPPKTLENLAKINAGMRDQIERFYIDEDPSAGLELVKTARRVASGPSFQGEVTGLAGQVVQRVNGLFASGEEAYENWAKKNNITGFKRDIGAVFVGAMSLAKAFTGLQFMSFFGRLVNRNLQFVPGSSLIPELLFGADISQYEKKAIRLKNMMGLGLIIAAIQYIMGDDEDDEERTIGVEGDWASLSGEQRDAKRTAKAIPSSIWVKGENGEKTYISFANTSLSWVLSAVANLHEQKVNNPEKWDENTKATIAAGGAFEGVKSLLNTSAMGRLTEILGGNSFKKSDPGAGVEKFAGIVTSFAGGFIPSVIRELDYIADPSYYEPKTLAERAVSVIPFLRRQVAESQGSLGVLGTPAQINRSPTSRVYSSGADTEAEKILARMADEGLYLPLPDDKAGRDYVSPVSGRKIQMTKPQITEYVKLTGEGYSRFILREGESLMTMPRDRAKQRISDAAGDIKKTSARMAMGIRE